MIIWGFDVGTTSVGSAVVDLDGENQTGKVIWMGTRIFPEAIVPEGGGSRRVTRNKQRRDARLTRRQLRRRRIRRKALTELLHERGLLPKFGSRDWAKVMALDPYALRAEGLDRLLEPWQVGRALYHLVKHRGFKSARIREEREDSEDNDKDEDEGQVKEAIGVLEEEMGSRTLAQHLKDAEKKRGRYLGREMVQREFERLWAAQAEHHRSIMTPDLKARFSDIAFRQRPIFWRLSSLGTCQLEPGKPLLSKSSWLGQRFVMLQTLNSLRLAGGNSRPLSEAEREVVLAELERKPKLTFGAIRKLLKDEWRKNGTPKGTKFNFEVGAGRKDIPGNLAEARLIEAFGDTWDGQRQDIIRAELETRLRDIHYRRVGNKRIEICSEAEAEENRTAFISAVQKDWAITAEQAGALSRVKPAPGWLRHSEAAISRLMPHLEEGKLYSEALDAEYPDRFKRDATGLDRLPSRQETFRDIRNPSVVRALNELRKVVNNLISVHGKPDLIRIELARDVKTPPAKRAEIMRANAARERERKQAAKALQENGIANPSGRDIEKYLLWRECNEICPFTGETIGFNDLFGASARFDVEHIFPLSLTLDNSFANKTLCSRGINIEKGNRSPYDAFHGTSQWEQIENGLKLSKLPAPKAARFRKASYADIRDAAGEERLLRDTSYIAREARKFLLQLFPASAPGSEKVEVVSGRLTRRLATLWGLYSLIDEDARKNRGDHRHHAIDALAVALTTRSAIKRLSDLYGEWQGAGKERERFPAPWPSLLEDAHDAFESIVVSHRSWRKINGPLHKEGHLGDTGEVRGTERYYVYRKPLADLSKNEVDAIRDGEIRRLARLRLEEHGGDVKKAFKEPLWLVTKSTGEAREVRKVRLKRPFQPGLMIPARPEPKTFRQPDENYCMAVCRNSSGKIEYEVVSRFEAKKRQSLGKDPVTRSSNSEREFLFSLVPGDVIRLPAIEQKGDQYRVVLGVWSAGPIVTQEIWDARGERESGNTVWRPTAGSLIEKGAQKVSVDPIGRVTTAND